jgi:YesN/AraC family two-component response regulator
LLQQFIFEVLEDSRAKKYNHATYTRIEKVVDYIHRSFQNKITLEELAEISELTPTYLSKIFRKITGYTITRFINRLKVDRAKELIIEGNNKIKEIAHLAGFEDEFYFSRVFKKVEGVSPSNYYIKYVDE